MRLSTLALRMWLVFVLISPLTTVRAQHEAIRVRMDDHGKVVDASAITGAGLLTHALKMRKSGYSSPTPKIGRACASMEGVCRVNDVSSQMIFNPPNFASITGCGRTDGRSVGRTVIAKR
ncbi:MAG TPA: hypothetical protein VIH56_01045 [Candidatus Acidoferrales bacterium]